MNSQISRYLFALLERGDAGDAHIIIYHKARLVYGKVTSGGHVNPTFKLHFRQQHSSRAARRELGLLITLAYEDARGTISPWRRRMDAFLAPRMKNAESGDKMRVGVILREEIG